MTYDFSELLHVSLLQLKTVILALYFEVAFEGVFVIN